MRCVKWMGISLCFIYLIFSAGCANEQSQEQRKRDDITRTLARLSRATGLYRGVLVQTKDRLVPAELEITVLNNPTKGVDDPILSGRLHIGLFGGVQIASTSSYFDWGSGKISFTFSQAASDGPGAKVPKPPMELRAQVDDKGIKDAVLASPRQGTFPLDIKRDGPTLFTSDGQFRYTWATSGAIASEGPQVPPDALLTINLRNDSVPSPANLDLPYLPGLNGTIGFNPLGKTPETASSLYYDPIGGTLELYFTSVSHLWFENLFLERNADSGLVPSVLDGEVLLGSINVAKLKATLIPSSEPFEIQQLPKRIFRGTYQGSGIAYRTDVYIDYLGSQLLNTLEFPFPVFPTLRAQVVICAGTEPQRRRILNMVSIDHLNGIAAFRLLGSPNPKDLELNYTPGWEKLDGYFFEGDGVGTPRPRVSVEPRNFEGGECADAP